MLCPQTVRTIMRSYVYLERARTICGSHIRYTPNFQHRHLVGNVDFRLCVCCAVVEKHFATSPSMLFKTCSRHVRCHGGEGVSKVYRLKSTRNSPACTSGVPRNLSHAKKTLGTYNTPHENAQREKIYPTTSGVSGSEWYPHVQ